MSNIRARLSILSELLSFPTIRGKDWTSSRFSDVHVIPGDLISINCASDSKWYLSWLIEYNYNDGNPEYLLENLEDGETCWWSNVGVDFYNREKLSRRPTWRWNDEQFEFDDRWRKVCFEDNGAYMVKPLLPKFNEDGSVILDVRIRWSLDNFNNPKEFENWQNLSDNEMDKFYNDSVKKYHEYREK